MCTNQELMNEISLSEIEQALMEMVARNHLHQMVFEWILIENTCTYLVQRFGFSLKNHVGQDGSFNISMPPL